MADLLDKYGRVRVARVVQAFYRDVLESPTLGGYFRDVDMHSLVVHQTAFMRAVLGDVQAYTREQIRDVHGTLHIGDADFEEMLDLLRRQLEAHQFDPEDTDQVIGVYRSYRPEVTTT